MLDMHDGDRMKRSAPPRRKTPLKRSGIRRTSGGSLAERRFRKAVASRARGECEACHVHWLASCPGTFAHAHHVVPRSEGVRWDGLHDPANGLGVSTEHHEWIHGHTREARAVGLLAHRGSVTSEQEE